MIDRLVGKMQHVQACLVTQSTKSNPWGLLTFPVTAAQNMSQLVQMQITLISRKEGNVLFNDTLNTFYLRLYGVRLW